MRRADGEGLREGFDKSRVVISHASHDYIRAADRSAHSAGPGPELSLIHI